MEVARSLLLLDARRVRPERWMAYARLSPSAIMVAGPKRSFRTALLTLVLGSLAITVGVIGAVGFFNSMNSLNELKSRQYDLTSRLMRLEINRLLTAPAKLVASLETLTARGLMPATDSERMAEFLAELLREEPELTWLSYSDAATGRFMGAWRDEDGSIVLNLSQPEVNEGRAREFRLAQDGSLEPVERDLEGGYDPRERPWFQAAADSEGPVWSDIYEFNDGEIGITLSQAVRDEAGELQGVLTADFSLEAINRFLDRINADKKRVLVLTTPDGQVLGQSANLGETVKPYVQGLLDALPGGLEALSQHDRTTFDYRQNGEKMVALAELDEVMPGFSAVAIVSATESQFIGSVLHNARMTIATGFGALVVAALIAFYLAARMARPLSAISADLARVAQFDLTKQAPPSSFVHEISVVSESVERMKAGLRSFGKYVPTTLVRRLLMQGQDAELGGQERELSIFFADLAGFTRISEQLTPAETVELMREYFDLATEAVESHEGTVDKFLGDGVLAFFNAPLPVEDHAKKACRAAIRIRDRLAAGQPARTAAGKPDLRVRIGITTGEVLVGNIGTADRFAYTVLGDTANLAARLESLNKQYGTSIMAAESVVETAGPEFIWRKLDRVAVKGRTSGTLVYELLGEAGEVAEETLKMRARYEAGLEAYFARNFDAAEQAFNEACGCLPEDPATQVMLERLRGFHTSPPGADWDGVHVALTK